MKICKQGAVNAFKVFACKDNNIRDTGPNTEEYGPWSGYEFLRAAGQPIRIQDSAEPYNK